MDGPEITFSEAIIDNGKFGKRVVRFETGRLARQAAGATVAYLDDETMLLSATTASSSPRDQFDFFPLTVDVEERMYAAGRIPGSFFRREGRPSTDAILAARLIDRPLRPTFIKGLRNEVQVVITVLALHPDDAYDVLAINAASASTQISGLPFSGPVGGVRISLIDGQWVAFPRYSEKEHAVFNMVVAGRIAGDDVAIMMVEAEAADNAWSLIKEQGVPAPTEEVVAEGLEAAKPFIKTLCEAQADLAARSAKEPGVYPVFLDYEQDAYDAVAAAASERLGDALVIVEKQPREAAIDQVRDEVLAELEETFAGREKEVVAALRSLIRELVRRRVKIARAAPGDEELHLRPGLKELPQKTELSRGEAQEPHGGDPEGFRPLPGRFRLRKKVPPEGGDLGAVRKVPLFKEGRVVPVDPAEDSRLVVQPDAPPVLRTLSAPQRTGQGFRGHVLPQKLPDRSSGKVEEPFRKDSRRQRFGEPLPQ